MSKANVSLKIAKARPAESKTTIASPMDLWPVAAEWLIPCAILCIFLRLWMGAAFLSSEQFMGTPGDTYEYMWFIGWIWHAISLHESPFVSSAFTYPRSIFIMDFSTSVPSLGLLFGWLYKFARVEFVYNLILVVNYLLIFLFGKLTLRELGIGKLFSGAGALLFCLLPYLTTQELGHLNLAFVAPSFMVAYLVVRIVHTEGKPSWRIGVCLGLCLLFAFYTNLETFATLILCLGVVYGCALLFARRITVSWMRRLLSKGFLVGLIAPLSLAIPGIQNFLQAQSAFDFTAGAAFFVNDLLSLIVPSNSFYLHDVITSTISSHFTGNPTEWNGYLSIPLITLFIIYAIRCWQEAFVRFIVPAALVMLILSLGPFLHIGGVQTHILLPWGLAVFVPFLRDALPSRIGLYAEYLVVVIVIYGADKYFKQAELQKVRVHSVLSIASVAVVALFWLPAVPFPTSKLPAAATVLSNNDIVPKYIAREPTLVLYDSQNKLTGAANFSYVMGVLASSHNYDLVTSNVADVYGSSVFETPSFKVNDALIHDKNGKQTVAALRDYLPQLEVQKVMFVSIDDRPLRPMLLAEISGYLGEPIYDGSGLVVIWTVPGAV